MPPKIVWLLSPILLYAAILLVLVWRGRAPSRMALNVQTSLLLVAYFLATAGLGIFWVANQQLPVFDWHYLFGYVTLLLVLVHLTLNLPVVLRYLHAKLFRKPPSQTQLTTSTAGKKSYSALPVGKTLALCTGLALMFFLGTRHAEQLPDFHQQAATSGPVDAVIRYHAFSSESRTGVFLRAPSVEWGTPPPEFKNYPDLPQINLPRANTGEQGLSQTLRAPWPRTQRLRLADLGELLYLSAGITARNDGSAYRAAPSSGALFPSELYVLVREIEGLPAGLYHYQAEQHRLARLKPGTGIDIGTADAETADAVVILTSIFRRTGFKYRDRAYRYAVADAGHLLENLRLAGHKAGLQARPLAQFDEAACAKALGIDGIEEGVLAMLALRPNGPGSVTQAVPGQDNIHYRAVPSLVSAKIGVTGMVHQASSLRRLEQPGPVPPAATRIALPAPEPSAKGVYYSISQRRSKRRFSDQPVPLGTLSSMLADMVQSAQLSPAIEINLVVNRVSGLAPGVYRYLPQHALLLLRKGDFGAQAQAAALAQEVIGNAAVVLILSGQREYILAQGARGYRHAFLEAGMLGERWLLGAVARNLGACPVGAFYDDEAVALISPDGKGSQDWVLHFAALGRLAD